MAWGDKKAIKGIVLPEGFNLERSYDLQALASGTANKEQQINALKYIVEGLAGTYNDTTDLSSDRREKQLQGRRSVGLDIVTITKLNLARISELTKTKEKN